MKSSQFLWFNIKAWEKACAMGTARANLGVKRPWLSSASPPIHAEPCRLFRLPPASVQIALVVTLLLVGLTACSGAAQNDPETSIPDTKEATSMTHPTDTGDRLDMTPIPSTEWVQEWLTGQPACRLPCFQGVTPGETSAKEAAETWRANPAFTEVTIKESPLPIDKTGHVRFTRSITRDGSGATWGNALFDRTTEEQIVYMIRLGFPEIRLGDLIEICGEPSHVMAYGAPPDELDGPYTWELDIIWLPSGLAMRMGGETEPQIAADLEFGRAVIFPPTLEGYGRATSPFYASYARPWHGYDKFDAYFEASAEE
ncbi:MAG TPA: hypothetical protein PKH77_24235 [Anaerolineae bacterium]|nr:hypothetical protein [Anaerolineae bacterium]